MLPRSTEAQPATYISGLSPFLTQCAVGTTTFHAPPYLAIMWYCAKLSCGFRLLYGTLLTSDGSRLALIRLQVRNINSTHYESCAADLAPAVMCGAVRMRCKCASADSQNLPPWFFLRFRRRGRSGGSAGCDTVTIATATILS